MQRAKLALAISAAVMLGIATDSRAQASFLLENGQIRPTGLPLVGSGPFAGQRYFPKDINDSGEIVGNFGSPQEGFTYVDGKITQLQVPGYVSTEVSSVNDAGVVVGIATQQNGRPAVGFILDNGTYSLFEAPASNFTAFYGINDLGQIVGSDNLGGFIDTNGALTQLKVPGSTLTQPTAINNSGEVVGLYFGATPADDGGFIYDNGVYTTYSSSDPSAISTAFYGIDSAGRVDGTVELDFGGAEGVFYSDGASSTFRVPDATRSTNTSLFGSSEDGTVVGFQFGVGAIPEPATWGMMLLGLGLAGATIRRRRQIFTIG